MVEAFFLGVRTIWKEQEKHLIHQYYRNEKDMCARHAVPPSIVQRVPRVALGLCLVASAHNHHHLQWVELQGEVVVQLFSTCFFVGDDEYLFFDNSMTIGLRGSKLRTYKQNCHPNMKRRSSHDHEKCHNWNGNAAAMRGGRLSTEDQLLTPTFHPNLMPSTRKKSQP